MTCAHFPMTAVNSVLNTMTRRPESGAPTSALKDIIKKCLIFCGRAFIIRVRRCAKAQSVSGFERKYNSGTFPQERDGVKGQMSSVQLEFAFARRGFLRCCRFAL